MKIPFGYCLSSMKELLQVKDMPYAQVTLNGRVFPAKRKTVEHLKNYNSPTEVIIHYDFIWIASRYLFFSQKVKKAILQELAELMTCPKIRGIVMHTDFPLRKEVYTAEPQNQKAAVNNYYTASAWDIPLIKGSLTSDDIVRDSINALFLDLRIVVPNPVNKIYLENTTRTILCAPDAYYGTPKHLVDIISTYTDMSKYFGVCIDTEHQFAVTGSYDIQLPFGISAMVHLNTIPTEVLPCSGKDRHSSTTIYECSRCSPEYYIGIANDLAALGVPVIREVKDSTRLREIEQWNSNNIAK